MRWGAKSRAPRNSNQVPSVSERDLRSELGYVWELPSPPGPVPGHTFHRVFEHDPVSAMADELLEREWRLADLRREIEALGGHAKGRTRRALAEQVAALFLDEARLAKAVAGLSEDDRNAYVVMLLQSTLQTFYVTPDTQVLWRQYGKSGPQLMKTLFASHLVLQGEDEMVFLPYVLYQRLPPIALPIPTVKQPSRVAPSADPHELLGQIQRLLTLLQTETFDLRPRLRWQAPVYPYAEPIVCWPPMPADAEKLIINSEHERLLGLLPPDPYLDAPSVEAWARGLDASPEWAEFFYHLLLTAGLILPGSPVLANKELSHEWMAVTPGQQIYAVLALYRHMTPWAIWWSRWRNGDMRVQRSYHGYWGLNSLDQTVLIAGTHLRWILLGLLAFLPEDAWLDLNVVNQLLAQLFPTVDSQRALMGLTLESVEGGWVGFLQTTLLEILTGPLYALGFVDVSPALDDVRAIRLRGFQAAHWGRIREVPLETTGQLSPTAMRLIAAAVPRGAKAPAHAVEGATLEVQTPVPPAFMSFVLRWARPGGFSKNRVRYELDVERLHQVFEGGEDPDALIESWTLSVGFEPLPQIVEWWQFWWERYGRVRLYPTQALLQTRDAFTLQEVQAALPNLQESILGILTPQAALLESEDVDKILNALMRQGYMPKESS